MSVEMVDWVFGNSRSRGTTRCILAVIAERADLSGGCWPSVADIMKRANCAERTVQLALSMLRKSGELYFAEPRRGGRSSSTLFVIVACRNEQEILRVAELTRIRRESLKGAGSNMNSSKPANENGATRGLRRAQIAQSNGAIRARKTAHPFAPESLLKPAAEPEKESITPQTLKETLSDSVATFLEPYYGERPELRQAPHHLVQWLLRDAGCDDHFANEVATHSVSPELVAECIIEMRGHPTPARNPGSVIRRALERRGVVFKRVLE